ncbi:hypothetical protein [Citricoccus sp.]|uniref:hypothetical protein n=1 Tax=Citricoccus sp. TaxID=1978372 RepID=UPI0028BDE067|nr:hypothetical protein [Citricoccus sp.]
MNGQARLRFTGHIAGVGTSGGTRLVLGRWGTSPHGPFADVMLQRPDGHRVLLAPDAWVAEFVAATYTFDEVLDVPVQVQVSDAGAAAGSRWHVTAGPLAWTFEVGPRTPLGHLLRTVPGPVGRSLTLARITDRVARWTLPGVRTLGSAGNGRLEWYAARDLHRITASTASWSGQDLGALTELNPPAEFGFSSTPRQPSLTTLTSTVRLPR